MDVYQQLAGFHEGFILLAQGSGAITREKILRCRRINLVERKMRKRQLFKMEDLKIKDF